MHKPRARFLTVLVLISAATALAFNNCSKFSSELTTQAASMTTPTPAPTSEGLNVMAVTVGNLSVPNEPTVSVTICAPGTTNCVKVDNVLLDTGSSGLRIFSSLLPADIQAALPSENYGECYSYIGGNIDWGSVSRADVQLGQETASSVPIQVIDQTYGDQGTSCYNSVVTLIKSAGNLSSSTHCIANSTSNPSTCPYFDTAAANSYNGVLGVNFAFQDCGSFCATHVSNYMYFSCSSGSCAQSQVSLKNQVANPIGYLAQDNNGLVLQLPSPGATGLSATSMTGKVYFGVGTQSNNTFSNVTTLTASESTSDSCYTYFQTQWQNQTICGYVDSGTTLYSFPMPSNSTTLPVDSYGIFVPGSKKMLSATNVGYNGTQSTVQFVIADPTAYFNLSTLAPLDSVIAFFGINSGSSTSGEGSIILDGDFASGNPFFFGRTS